MTVSRLTPHGHILKVGTIFLLAAPELNTQLPLTDWDQWLMVKLVRLAVASVGLLLKVL